MRILYLHQYFVVPEGAGGTRSFEFARRFITNGHEVTILTSTAMLPEPYRSATDTQRIELHGIPVVAVAQAYDNTMSFVQRIRVFTKFALLASLEAVRQPVDVIFATSTPLTIAIPAVIARIRHRRPMVFEVRDLWPELPIAMGALQNPMLKLLAQALEWTAYHSAAELVALSPGMKAGIVRRGIPPERVTIIPNSADNKIFDVPPERGHWVCEKLDIHPEQVLIVYTGTFGLINGVDYLVDVAAAMRDIDSSIHFLLVGNGHDAEKVKRKALALGVHNVNLAIWKPIPKVDLVAVLAAATIATSLFLPIKEMENNSANKFFDALAAGKPVAINYGGWQAELLQENGAGIVLPYHNTQAAARLLADFVSDKQTLAAARTAARHLAQTHFDRDRLAAQLERVLVRAASS